MNSVNRSWSSSELIRLVRTILVGICLLGLASEILPTGAQTLGQTASSEEGPADKKAQSAAETDAGALPTLKVRTIDKDGKPIANAVVLVYDRNHRYAGKKEDFPKFHGYTEKDGWVDLGELPQDYVCVQVNPGPGYDTSYAVIYEGENGLIRMSAERPLIKLKSDKKTVQMEYTMRKGVDLRFEVVDAATGKPVWWPEFFYEDQDRWWMFALIDGGGQHNFSTIVPEMSDRQLRVAAAGYEPVSFRLDNKLELGKRSHQRIEMQPKPKMQFQVLTPGGRPAAGAMFRWITPPGLDYSVSIAKRATQNGKLVIDHHPHADVARVEITHSTGRAELALNDLPEDGVVHLDSDVASNVGSPPQHDHEHTPEQLAEADRFEDEQKRKRAERQRAKKEYWKQHPTKVEGYVLGTDKQPIQDARIFIRDYVSDEDAAFEAIYLRTDQDGRFEAEVPAERFPIHVGSPTEDYDNAGITVSDGHASSRTDATIEDNSSDSLVRLVVTLAKSYQLDFELVDATTGNPIHDAAVLYKLDVGYWDDEWGDYEADASWSAYRVLLDGQFLYRRDADIDLGSAHLLIGANGYQPVQLKLDEKLERGNRVLKQIRLKKLPPVELSFRTSDGRPATGVTFSTLPAKQIRDAFNGSKAYKGRSRLMDIEVTSDGQGDVRIPCPAFGDWTSYRVEHPAGHAVVNLADIRSTTKDMQAIRSEITLAPYARVRGRYLPGVLENEYLEVYLLQSDRMSVDGPSERVTLDEGGRFDVGPRRAGWHSFVHRSKTSTGSMASASFGPFHLEDGETLDVTIGDEGRTVTGRVLFPDDAPRERHRFPISVAPLKADGSVDFRDRPRPPGDLQDEAAVEKWWDNFWDSDEGREYHNVNNQGHVSAYADFDGRFRFPRLRPGKYRLGSISTGDDRNPPRAVRPVFAVPSGPSSQPVDVGDFQFE